MKAGKSFPNPQAEKQGKKTGLLNKDLPDLRKAGELFETNDLKKGETVYPFTEIVAGDINPGFVAVTKDKNGNAPYYEIPADAVDWK